MIAPADLRSDAARRANETRRAEAAARERAIAETVAALRGIGFDKDPERERVADFLAQFGGSVADMTGPNGASARVLARRGLDVISADNGTLLTKPTMLPQGLWPFMVPALEQMAAEDGWSFRNCDFRDILPGRTSAFADLCGPYLEKTARIVRAMRREDLRAFALTIELSRVNGGKDEDGDPEWYLRMARRRLREDAPKYSIVDVLRYSGKNNIPMAVLLVKRPKRPGEARVWATVERECAHCHVAYLGHAGEGRRRNRFCGDDCREKAFANRRLGLSEDFVGNFRDCRKCGRPIPPDRPRMAKTCGADCPGPKRDDVKCFGCGAAFTYAPRKKWCSRECWAAWTKRHPTPATAAGNRRRNAASRARIAKRRASDPAYDLLCRERSAVYDHRNWEKLKKDPVRHAAHLVARYAAPGNSK